MQICFVLKAIQKNTQNDIFQIKKSWPVLFTPKQFLEEKKTLLLNICIILYVQTWECLYCGFSNIQLSF
jgi:hypothetical protein